MANYFSPPFRLSFSQVSLPKWTTEQWSDTSSMWKHWTQRLTPEAWNGVKVGFSLQLMLVFAFRMCLIWVLKMSFIGSQWMRNSNNFNTMEFWVFIALSWTWPNFEQEPSQQCPEFQQEPTQPQQLILPQLFEECVCVWGGGGGRGF